MKRTALSMLAISLLVTATHAANQFVSVPEATWTEFSPYLEANLRIDYVDGTIVVGASGAAYERDLIEPYDAALGELATVLLVEGVTDRRVREAVEDATRAIKESGVDVAAAPRDELIAIYWKQLTADDRFTGRLRELFLRAQATGRLRCSICGEGFKPQHLAVK